MIAATGVTSALDHIARAFRSSETRTPLIVCLEDGNPGASIDYLARQQGSRVWSINMEGAGSEQNALDYLDVATHTGDHLLLTNSEDASYEVMRKIGLQLMTLKPEPAKCPRREYFRLWLQVNEKPVNVNEHVKPLFPQVIMQNAIFCKHTTTGKPPSAAGTPEKGGGDSPSAASATGGGSPTKLMLRAAAEPPLLKAVLEKHDARRAGGRDSDSDSDMEEPEKKITGLAFHRACEFFACDNTQVTDFKKIIFDEVDNENVEAIQVISGSGHIDIDKVKRDGMTPLMYAVSRQREKSVKALIEAGADVTLRRESDGSPLIFMAIENPVILKHLIEGEFDMKTKYEGHLLEDHPDTDPNIASMIRQMRRDGKFN